MDALSDTLYAQRCAFILRGEADNATESWEAGFRRPFGVMAEATEKDVKMLTFCIRSGLFKEPHLLRLQAAAVTPTADDYRDAFLRIVRFHVSKLGEVSPERRTYGTPDINGLQVLNPWAKQYPWGPTLLSLLPRKAGLLADVAELKMREAYGRDLEALRGTQEWADFQDYPANPLLGRTLGNRPAEDGWHMGRDIVAANVLRAVMAFGIYENRTGRIPTRLEDFMDAQAEAAIIHIPHMQMEYTVDPSGIARIAYAFEPSSPLRLRQYSGKYLVRDIVVHHPSDRPFSFPISRDMTSLPTESDAAGKP
jgi:hypothetical protein